MTAGDECKYTCIRCQHADEYRGIAVGLEYIVRRVVDPIGYGGRGETGKGCAVHLRVYQGQVDKSVGTLAGHIAQAYQVLTVGQFGYLVQISSNPAGRLKAEGELPAG